MQNTIGAMTAVVSTRITRRIYSSRALLGEVRQTDGRYGNHRAVSSDPSPFVRFFPYGQAGTRGTPGIVHHRVRWASDS
jgi:hypothetical protein